MYIISFFKSALMDTSAVQNLKSVQWARYVIEIRNWTAQRFRRKLLVSVMETFMMGHIVERGVMLWAIVRQGFIVQTHLQRSFVLQAIFVQ